MQPLAKRHEDRARRLANNGAERKGDPTLSVGTVAIAYSNYASLRSRLGEVELAELDTNIPLIDEEFSVGNRSLAEAEDGSTMAGIGVVNPLVVPSKPTAVKNLPESEIDPEKGNINGQALTEQLGDPSGWGSTGTASSADIKASGKAPEKANAGNGGGAAKSE